jgi:dienelactone hydrolase
LVDGIACRSDPTQTYAVYLPSDYDPPPPDDPTGRRWPILFVFDPRGRGAIAGEIFRAAAEEHGWVLASSNNTRSDEPGDANARAIGAMLPDVGERFAVDGSRIYLAGFSGTATFAWRIAQSSGALAGLIAVGAPPASEIPTESIGLAHFGAAGRWDFNFSAMHDLDAVLARRGAHHRLEVFTGRHQWLPPALASEAVRWLEVVAMREGRRPVDPALVERAWQNDLAAAQGLEAAGEVLAARERYRILVETFTELRDVAAAKTRLEALRTAPEAERAERELARWIAWEDAQLRTASAAIRRLDDPETLDLPERLATQLGVRDLLRRTEKDGIEADAAHRVLESLYVQLSFYLMRDYFAARRYGDAATVLAVAAEIRAEPHVLYNLGAAEARLRNPKRALAALERAITAGWRDVEHLLADEDFAGLRDDEGFQALVLRLRDDPAALP